MSPSGEVDWAEAESAELRAQLWAWPFVVAFFGGMLLCRGGFGFWDGRTGWLVVSGYLAFVGVLLAFVRLHPRARERARSGYRLMVALRRHADPGPELRERADRQARTYATRGWVAWLAPVGPLAVIADGRWAGHPVQTAAGAVLLVGATVAWARWWLRLRDAGRRWVADPPGPPREPPPITARERWTSGRRVAWLFLGVVVVTAGATALTVLLR